MAPEGGESPRTEDWRAVYDLPSDADAIPLTVPRIVVGAVNGTAGCVDSVGGLVRMPLRHSSRIGARPKDAA